MSTSSAMMSALSSSSDVTTTLAGIGAVSKAAGGKAMNAQQADKVSKDFESLFITQMLGQMFGESVGDDAFGDSESSEIYRGMMMEQYGKQISNSGGIGIADYIKRELLKTQEV